MFKQKNQDGLTKNTYEKLQKYIAQTTGKMILDNNISRDLKLIEQNLLNHLMYALNYKIDKAPKSQKVFEKESQRFLIELSPKKYFKLFGRESMNIYNLCNGYIKMGAKHLGVFVDELWKHKDVIIPILEKVKGQKKYDMINLLTCNRDVIEADEYMVSLDIANTLKDYYRKIEEKNVDNLLRQYKRVDKFADDKCNYWQGNLDIKKKHLIIKWFSNENIKNPTRIKIDVETVVLYEGYKNYYFCNTEDNCCYCVPKDCRVIMKSNKNHQTSLYKIA